MRKYLGCYYIFCGKSSSVVNIIAHQIIQNNTAVHYKQMFEEPQDKASHSMHIYIVIQWA